MKALVVDDSLLTKCVAVAVLAEQHKLCHVGFNEELKHGINRTGVLSTLDARLLNLLVFALQKAADAGLCETGLDDMLMHDVVNRQTQASVDGKRIVRGGPAQDGMKVGGLTYNELRSELQKREDELDGN